MLAVGSVGPPPGVGRPVATVVAELRLLAAAVGLLIAADSVGEFADQWFVVVVAVVVVVVGKQPQRAHRATIRRPRQRSLGDYPRRRVLTFCEARCDVKAFYVTNAILQHFGFKFLFKV